MVRIKEWTIVRITAAVAAVSHYIQVRGLMEKKRWARCDKGRKTKTERRGKQNVIRRKCIIVRQMMGTQRGAQDTLSRDDGQGREEAERKQKKMHNATEICTESTLPSACNSYWQTHVARMNFLPSFLSFFCLAKTRVLQQLVVFNDTGYLFILP